MKRIVYYMSLISALFVSGCNKQDCVNNKYGKLHAESRALWQDHMHYTYVVVDAYFNNSTAVEGSLARLLRNQQDIGNSFRVYYGDYVADKVTSLLTEHINLAVPVLEAVKKGDEQGLEKAMTDWYDNANDIAIYLHAVNPKQWPEADLQNMMRHHISTTFLYAAELYKKDYISAVFHYDLALEHMMHLSDTITNGIYKQFPDKF